MTEREKIIDILNKNFTQEVECTPVYTTADGKEIELPQELCDIFNDIVTQAVIPYFADALIAAGMGDVKEADRRAEAAEKERDEYRNSNRIVLRGIEIIKRNILRYCATDFPTILQQAEREIEEGKKDE